MLLLLLLLVFTWLNTTFSNVLKLYEANLNKNSYLNLAHVLN